MNDTVTNTRRRVRGAPTLQYSHLSAAEQKEYYEVTFNVAPTRQETLTGESLNGWYDTGGYVFDRHPTRLAQVDWRQFRDPERLTFRSYNNGLAEQAAALAHGTESLLGAGYLEFVDSAWQPALQYLAALRFHEAGVVKIWQLVEYAAQSESLSCCAIQECGSRLLAVHSLNRYALDLATVIPGWNDDNAMDLWVDDPVFIGAREYVEHSLTVKDWSECIVLDAIVAAPLYYEPLLRFFAINGATHGDVSTATIVSALSGLSKRRTRWAKVFLEIALGAEVNRAVIAEWLATWERRADVAMHSLGPLYAAFPRSVLNFDVEVRRARAAYRALVEEIGVDVMSEGEWGP